MTGKARWNAALAVVLGLTLGAPLAQAQTARDTRAGLSGAARDAAAAAPTRQDVSRVERLLNTLEHGRMRQLLSARDGFSLRIGGIDDGSGLAAGPRWRKSTLFGGNLILHGSAVTSLRLERGIEAGWAVPALGTNRVSLAMDLSAAHLTRERLFALHPGPSSPSVTTFGVDQRLVSTTLTVAATDWLQISSRVGHLHTASTAPPGSGVPLAGAPGLGAAPAFAVASMSATADARDVPGNPRRGGRYHIAVERFDARGLARSSFTRVNADLEQHVSMLKRQRLVTLRGVASLSQADPGHDVPIFLQPTLGGSQLLRGFVTDRFRAPNILVLQAEYGWDLWPFVNAVLFYETGTATAAWQQALALRDLRRDYGLGFRFGSARTVALRTDVAFGSGEGTRISMRLNHAF